MISGPLAWRRTLLTAFQVFDFKQYPLAPCVVTLYDIPSKGKEILIGVILTDTDYLLGRGIGPKWTAAFENLRNESDFGRWRNSWKRRRKTEAVSKFPWGAIKKRMLMRFHLAEGEPRNWNPPPTGDHWNAWISGESQLGNRRRHAERRW